MDYLSQLFLKISKFSNVSKRLQAVGNYCTPNTESASIKTAVITLLTTAPDSVLMPPTTLLLCHLQMHQNPAQAYLLKKRHLLLFLPNLYPASANLIVTHFLCVSQHNDLTASMTKTLLLVISITTGLQFHTFQSLGTVYKCAYGYTCAHAFTYIHTNTQLPMPEILTSLV